MTLNKVNVQSVDPRAQKGSAASEEPKLGRENPLVFRDGGNIKGDVHPLRIIREGIVVRKVCQTEEKVKLFFWKAEYSYDLHKGSDKHIMQEKTRDKEI